MRLLLDAHLSGARVGGQLRERGHDVRALNEERAAEGLDDEQVLELARSDRRVLVTHDVRTIPDVLRRWAEAERSHAGVILVYGIRHDEFRQIAEVVDSLVRDRPRQADWTDLVMATSRAT
jgi:hypothetical protein